MSKDDPFKNMRDSLRQMQGGMNESLDSFKKMEESLDSFKKMKESLDSFKKGLESSGLPDALKKTEDSLAAFKRQEAALKKLIAMSIKQE